MGDRDHIELLARDGVDAWNSWRMREDLAPDLNGANFNDRDLSKADLSETDLSSAQLRGCLLRGANLRAAVLSDADLSGADLTDARMEQSSLDGARLERAILDRADLSESSIIGVDLSTASLDQTRLDRARWDSSTTWPEALAPPGTALVSLKGYDVETHVEDALFEARVRDARGVITARSALEAIVAVSHAQALPAFKELASIVPLPDVDPFIPAKRATIPLDQLLMSSGLAQSFAVAAEFLEPGTMIWGRDFATVVVLAQADPTLPLAAKEAGVRLETIQDAWFSFVVTDAQRRSRDAWEAWWAAADVPLPDQRALSGDSTVQTTQKSEPQGARLAPATADVIPEPGQGNVRRADTLGISGDVEMLASVCLARDTSLPMAIGLFGYWGSGKSFFMAHMQERIDELAELARTQDWPLCSRVKQIRFNAWHYVDTDLWASLASTLFDQLAETVAPDDTGKKANELLQARKSAAALTEERVELEAETRQLEQRLSGLTSAAASGAHVALRTLREQPELIRQMRDGADDGKPADPKVDDLLAELGALEGTADRGKATWLLFRDELMHAGLRTRLPSLLIAAVLVVGVLVLVNQPAVSAALAAVSMVGGVVSPALAATRQVLVHAREVRQEREAPLLEKQLQLAHKVAEEAQAHRKVAELQQELAETHDPDARFWDFVMERSKSGVYVEQLGTISQVRSDFEHLVALMQAAGQASTETPDGTTRRKPRFERIILYIDDLDRCPHDKVVAVLQAVHLMLAFPLFVVVVAVDSRWLSKSLEAQYHDLLEDPATYLEKIFQIPFVLQPMPRRDHRRLMDELTRARPSSAATTATGTASPRTAQGIPLGEAAQPMDEETSDVGSSTQADDTSRLPSADVGTEIQSGSEGQLAAAETPPPPPPAALVLSDQEREYLGMLAHALPTPRAAKRFVNIYRMLRVSVPADEEGAYAPSAGGEFQVAATLLAVLIGLPDEAPTLFRTAEAADANSDLWMVLTASSPHARIALEPVKQEILAHPLEVWQRWLPRVSRFSFRMQLAADDAATTHPDGPTPHRNR